MDYTFLEQRKKALWNAVVEDIAPVNATVSYSEVSLYRRCPKAWEYRYKRGLKRHRKFVHLFRGEILHEMLNAHIKMKMSKGRYTGGDAWDVLAGYEEKFASYFQEEKEYYGDVPGDCGKIFEGYLRKWRKDPLKYEASEEPVFFDLPGKLPRFIGYLDKVALDAEGRRWIVDHKFVSSIPTAEDRFSELQLLLYVWAWNHTHPDKPVDGVCWDYARSKAPREPELLKGGGLSKRKDMDTDVYTYTAAIAKHKLDPNDYAEMLQNLEGKEDTFFERVFLPAPSPAMVEEVTQDFLQTTSEIQLKKAKGKTRCSRNMSSFNCKTCEYRQVCEAEVRGLDAEFIIKSEFKKRETGDD